MAFSLIFAAALAVTNAPASFSTAVERTFPCPVIGEPAVGRRYAFTIPESGCARLELALGTDSDGDGRLADEESPFAVTLAGGSLDVRDGRGTSLYHADGCALISPLALDLKPGKDGGAATWRLYETEAQEIANGLLAVGLDLAEWTVIRVRVSGPETAGSHIGMFRLRDAFTFVIR